MDSKNWCHCISSVYTTAYQAKPYSYFKVWRCVINFCVFKNFHGILICFVQDKYGIMFNNFNVTVNTHKLSVDRAILLTWKDLIMTTSIINIQKHIIIPWQFDWKSGTNKIYHYKYKKKYLNKFQNRNKILYRGWCFKCI